MQGVRGHCGPPFLSQNIGDCLVCSEQYCSQVRSAMILNREGEPTNGKRVTDCEADEEGTGKGREAVVSIEFGPVRFCRNVLRSQNSKADTQEANDVSGRPEENRGGSTRAMGEGEARKERSLVHPKLRPQVAPKTRGSERRLRQSCQQRTKPRGLAKPPGRHN